MKKYYNIIALIFVVTSLSSCLKDKYNALDPEKSPSVVEFKNPGPISSTTPGSSLYSMYTFTYGVVPNIDVVYTVQLSGSGPAKEDVNVTIGIDKDAVDKFNKDELARKTGAPTLYLPDASTYSIAKTNYVIPKGQRSVDVTVSYKTEKFDFRKMYAFPLSITSTSFGAVSKNFGTILLNVRARNPYDGVYRVTNVSFSDLINPKSTIVTPRTRHLQTTSAFENESWDPAGTGTYGVFYTKIVDDPADATKTISTPMYYTNFTGLFKFDNTGNVTVRNGLDFANNSEKADAVLDPTGVNKMVVSSPSSKVMEVSYIRTVNGVNTVLLKEKWEYTGARP